MAKRSDSPPSKTRLRRWEAFVPLAFIIYLIFTMFWQYRHFSRLTTWIDESDSILWELKETDNRLLEMHNHVRTFQLTKRQESLDGYRESRERLMEAYDRLNTTVTQRQLEELLTKLRVDIQTWFDFGQEVLWRETRGESTIEITQAGVGSKMLANLRNQISNVIETEIELRRGVKEQLEKSALSFYVLSSVGLFFISLLFLLNWRRQRKWARALQSAQDMYRNTAISATEAEERLRGLMESALDMIFIADRSGKLLFVNDQICHQMGYQREELLGQDMSILIPEADLEMHLKEREEVFNQLTAKYYSAAADIHLKRKDQVLIPVEVSLGTFSMKGRVEVVAIIRNITERKSYEQRQKWMAEVSDLLSQTLDPSKILTTLGDFCLGKCSDWTMIVTLTEPPRVVRAGPEGQGVVVDLFVHTPIRPLRAAFISWLEEKGPTLKQDLTEEDLRRFPIDQRDLNHIFELGVKSAMVIPLNARGRVLGAIIHIACQRNYEQDDLIFATELGGRGALALDNAHLYQKAQQVSKAEEELVRIVSHDLKNPLNSLRLNIQMLERKLEKETLDDEELRERLPIMKNIIDRAIHLIKELLDTAKLETGGLELDKRPIEISHLMQETKNLFQPLAEEKGVDLLYESHLTTPATTVNVDHERVLQVISNLIGNAIKFTPKGGKIWVSCKDIEKGVCFTVKDTGPGIAPEKVEHLFEKYWKDKNSGKQNLGLGLTIAKGIVEAHGGRIWSESVFHKGTSFHFILPKTGQEHDEVYLDSEENLVFLRKHKGDNLEVGDEL